MNINQDNINMILNKYIDITDRICLENSYDSNIKHLLYIIIPAFIIRYGPNYESTVLKCFESTKIYISQIENKVITAYFSRTLHKRTVDNKEDYYTNKTITLNEYKTASMTALMDNIIHEFNHAVNSVNNELKYDDSKIMMRTGLSYFTYNKNNLNQYLSKTDDIMLEEIVNTKQTADIINIINSFSKYSIENEEFSNALYSLKHEIGTDQYTSGAYGLGSYIAKQLIENKTFISTIETLRFKGFVDDIPNWFDNVTGEEGSYKTLTSLLQQISVLEDKYNKAKFFKKHKLELIREKMNQCINIIKDFDDKCIFK